MSRFSKFAVAAVLGGAGLLLTPGTAPAQFYGGFGRPYMGLGIGAGPVYGLQPLPSLPSLPGLPGLPALGSFPFGGNGYNFINAPFALGGYGQSYGQYIGQYVAGQYAYQYLQGGYTSGGSGAYSSLDPYQQHLYRAQQSAGSYSSYGGRSGVADSGAYETNTVPPGAVRNAPQPEVLQKALAASSEAEVASGEALNHILAAILAAEAKQKPRGVPAAYLPPNLVAEIRFGGTPSGDALNLLRSSGKLELPAAFEADALRGAGEALKRDFAAVAAGPLAGKPVDQAKVVKLAQAVKEAQVKLPAATRDLPFHEAADARRFVSQMDATAKVLREAGSSTLLNPKWATEGTNVADLARHMARHKLQFGRVDKGGEEAYLTLHRALAGYLFALTEAQAKK
jgi:hypothetical protein